MHQWLPNPPQIGVFQYDNWDNIEKVVVVFKLGCGDRTITRTIANAVRNWDATPVSGHDYKEMPHKDINIHLLECVQCGHRSAAWKYNEVSIEELKAIEEYGG